MYIILFIVRRTHRQAIAPTKTSGFDFSFLLALEQLKSNTLHTNEMITITTTIKWQRQEIASDFHCRRHRHHRNL